MYKERRVDQRIPVELSITQFVDDRPFPCLASDLSLSGLQANRLLAPLARSSRFIQLEIPLPGLDDPLWASAEVVYDALNPFFHSSGVHFLNMAAPHRLILNEWLRRANSDLMVFAP